MMRSLAVTTTLAAAAAALAVAGTTGHAAAAPQEKESRIEDLRLGEYWFGPEIDTDDLIGKVVLVEIWGS